MPSVLFLENPLVLHIGDIANWHVDPLFKRAARERGHFNESIYDHFRESRSCRSGFNYECGHFDLGIVSRQFRYVCLYADALGAGEGGKAPRFLAKLNVRGVPVAALLATGALGMLAFLASFFGDGVVYVWLLNASGMSGFIVWLGIAISHYRFRRAYVSQGHKLEDLAYLAKWFPIGPILAMLLCIVVIGGQFIGALKDGRIDWAYIFASYIGIPLFLAIFIGHKWKYRTRMLTLAECKLDPED